MKRIIFFVLFGFFSKVVIASINSNISVTSDYVWRGQTQNNHEAAIQGGLDFDHKSGLSLGTWLSNVSGNQTEADFYAKYSFSINKNIKLSLGSAFYHYTHSGTSDALEYSLGLSLWIIDMSVNYMGDYFGSDSSSVYYQASTAFDICKKNQLRAILSLGYTTFDDENKTGSSDHIDYKFAFSKKVDSSTFEIFYSDTNRSTSKGLGNIDQDDHALGVSLNQSF